MIWPGERIQYLGSPGLGAMHAASFAADPKHLGFVLARYHFVARMLQGAGRALEVGAGDGTGANLVIPAVKEWAGIDREPLAPSVIQRDMLDGPWGSWDAIYALDVLEHIPVEDERRFLSNIVASLAENGTVIVGMPSLESQVHASELSRQQHVNCKTEQGLRVTLARHFRNVFLFGMNDTTLHVGFGPFCQYRLALCCGAL